MTVTTKGLTLFPFYVLFHYLSAIIPDAARADEGASRFIQKRLKFGPPEEQQLGMKAALSSIEDLWRDHYGNFMLQGIFEFGTKEMKRELMDAIYGQDVVALCLHMHGYVMYFGTPFHSFCFAHFHHLCLNFLNLSPPSL